MVLALLSHPYLPTSIHFFSYHCDFRPLHPLRLNKVRHHIIRDNQHLQSQQQTHQRFQQTIPEHLLRPRMAYPRYYR